MSIATDAVCKTRVKLFKEYFSSAHASWDSKEMQEEVDAYKEMKRLKLEESLAEQGADDEVDAGGVDKSLRNDENLDAAEGQNAGAGVGSIQKDASSV